MKADFKKIMKQVLSVSFLFVFLLLGSCDNANGQTQNRLYNLLNLVPIEIKGEDPIMVTITDYASFRTDYASFRIDNNIALEEYFDLMFSDPVGEQLVGRGSFITGGGVYGRSSALNYDKYLGYNLTYVDAEIQAGIPPTEIVAAIGRFDPGATTDALDHQDEWPSWAIDNYAAFDYRGVKVHTWGQGTKMDLSNRLSPPHLDEFGRARPLSVTKDYLFYAASENMVKLMISASKNATKSLADIPEYASVAKGLNELGVYAAIIADASYANGDPRYTDNYPGTRLKKFTTFGSGIARDEKGTFMALVLVHESPDDVAANISLLEQRIDLDRSVVVADTPWSKVFTETVISVQDSILMAKLYTKSTSVWWRWVYSGDPLLLH